MAREADLHELLDDVEAHLERDELEHAKVALAKARALSGADHPDTLYGEACIAWQEAGPRAAVPLLSRVLALDEGHADAHYALARAAEEHGQRALAIEHDLHVLRLDARHARQSRLATPARLERIEQVAYQVLHELPAPFAERLAHVPVILESRPTPDLVRDGFDPRALGLFEGPTHGDTSTVAPTRIVLYTHNLLADFPEQAELESEIEITLLHEIGHFFGLEEADMARLGLEE
jgi:predicted Zn-dependent protease with MMP-like domain